MNEPIKNKEFLKWLRKKSKVRKQKKQIKKVFNIKNYHDKKNAFNKLKGHNTTSKQKAKWCLIKKRFKEHAGYKPPWTLKDWFYSF